MQRLAQDTADVPGLQQEVIQPWEVTTVAVRAEAVCAMVVYT
jgi:hypothetical protein